jgi:hypothetical protein
MRHLLTRIVILMLAVCLLAGTSLTPQTAVAQTTPPSDIRITITESFINHMVTTPTVTDITAGLPTPVEIRGINILTNNRLDLTVFTTLPAPFGATELTLTIALVAAAGDLTLTIETLTIRGASLPANNPLLAGQIMPIQEQIQSAASDGLAGLADSAGLELSGIRTTDTLITIFMSAAQE